MPKLISYYPKENELQAIKQKIIKKLNEWRNQKKYRDLLYASEIDS